MWATGWLRRRAVDLGWGVFALANVAAMVRWERWETIPFHFIWVSLTLLYGFRPWPLAPTFVVLGGVQLSTSASIFVAARHGTQEWGELFEVPLMSAMFLAMVWHARRRQEALAHAEREAAERSTLLEQQERFQHDVSHELRTPVTIARGHLEVLRRIDGGAPEIDVALDELQRIEHIVERLLLLAKAGREDFLSLDEVELEPFLEDLFMRWSEVAPRAWLLGPIAAGRVDADAEALRTALDALLENAVKHTEPNETIELSADRVGAGVEIRIRDGGAGVPDEALAWIFERFARGDAARTRDRGGVGLGLAIVEAIAQGHGGGCSVASSPEGSTFAFRLPGFHAAAERTGRLAPA